jgi:hypothetical protein
MYYTETTDMRVVDSGDVKDLFENYYYLITHNILHT